MFSNPYFNKEINYKGNKSKLLFANYNYLTKAPNSLAKGLLSKSSKNKFLLSSSSKSKYNINYTFSDQKNLFLHKGKSTKNIQNKSLNSKINKNKSLIIVNDYLKKYNNSFNNWTNLLKLSKENNINYSRSKNNEIKSNLLMKEKYAFYNGYNNDNNNNENISKISKNISSRNNENILNDTALRGFPSQKSSSGFLEFYNDNSFRANNNSKNISEDKIHMNYKFNINSIIKSSLPIFKKINILKEVKSSLNKIKKNKFSNSSFFQTFYDESNQSKNSNYSGEKNKYEISTYKYKDYFANNIFNNKPVFIKHKNKPKLYAQKYNNLNNIQIPKNI